MKYYQIVGRGPWMIDYPHGDSKAHRPGDVVEADPNNASVERGLRQSRLRELEPREARALEANKTAMLVKPTPGLPAQAAVKAAVALPEPAKLKPPTPITPTKPTSPESGK